MTKQPKPRRRRTCSHGAKCRYCRRKGGDGRTRFEYPDGQPHPFPHRHFVCENANCPFLIDGRDPRRKLDNAKRRAEGLPPLPNRWNFRIPDEQLLE